MKKSNFTFDKKFNAKNTLTFTLRQYIGYFIIGLITATFSNTCLAEMELSFTSPNYSAPSQETTSSSVNISQSAHQHNEYNRQSHQINTPSKNPTPSFYPLLIMALSLILTAATIQRYQKHTKKHPE